jgi:hypothetical protein
MKKGGLAKLAEIEAELCCQHIDARAEADNAPRKSYERFATPKAYFVSFAYSDFACR